MTRLRSFGDPAVEVFYGESEGQQAQVQETRGKRVAVTVPGNVCLIRTAQDWCNSTAFKDDYFASRWTCRSGMKSQ